MPSPTRNQPVRGADRVMVSPAAQPPSKKQSLSGLSQQMESLLAQSGDVCARIRNLANGLDGPEPENASAVEKVPHGSHVDSLHAVADAIRSQLTYVEYQLTRIESRIVA